MIRRFTKGEFADRSFVHAANRLDVELVGTGLEIDQEAQPVAGGFLAAFFHGLAAGHIHGDGLGEIHVFSRCHAGRRMLRVEVRRRFHDDGIQLLLQHALVARQSGVTRFGFHIQLAAEVIETILEIVGRRHDVVATVFLEQFGNPRAAATAANEADIDLLIGLIAPDQLGSQNREARGGRSGTGQEAAP